MTDTEHLAQTKNKRLRRCTACRQMKEKRELLRIVRTPNGTVLADPGGRMDGRGAYVCRSEACIAAAQKKKTPDRALHAAVPQEIYDILRREAET